MHTSLPFEEDRVAFLEDIESALEQLKLPQDFLNLGDHYGISPPSHASLSAKMTEEANARQRNQKNRVKARWLRFAKETVRLRRDFSVTPVFVASMSLLTDRHRVFLFIFDFIDSRGACPEGK